MLITGATGQSRIKQQIWRTFTQTHGLSIQADACEYLCDEITKLSQRETSLDLAVLLESIVVEYKRISGIFLPLLTSIT